MKQQGLDKSDRFPNENDWKSLLQNGFYGNNSSLGSSSPGINVTEHIWSMLDRNISRF